MTSISGVRLQMNDRRFAVILGLMALVLYVPTWSPVVTWAHYGEDGPELEAAGRTLGIPHPTGYPLFMLLVRGVSILLPPPVAAVNVVTLLAAVLGVVATGFAGRALGRRAFPTRESTAWGSGFAAAAVWATSLTWWKQAVIGEVYTLHLALAALALALCFGENRRKGILAAYVLGLACCHHLQSLPLLLVVLVYSFRFRSRVSPAVPAAFLFPLTLYAVSMIRSSGGPAFDWGNPETADGLWWMLSGAPYQKNLFAAGIGGAVKHWIEAGSHTLPAQIGWGGAVLALGGILTLFKRIPRAGTALVLLFGGTLFVASAYSIPDPAAYYLPAILAGSLAAGVGWGAALCLVEKRFHRPGVFRAAASAGLAAMLAGTIAAQVVRVRPVADATGEADGYQYARAGVDVLERGALVVSHGDGRTFSLWYGTAVLEQRSDVAVLYDNLLDWPWYRKQVVRNHPWVKLPRQGVERMKRRELLISRHLGLRPVYVTEVDPFMLDRYLVQPAGPLFRLAPRTSEMAYWSSQ